MNSWTYFNVLGLALILLSCSKQQSVRSAKSKHQTKSTYGLNVELGDPPEVGSEPPEGEEESEVEEEEEWTEEESEAEVEPDPTYEDPIPCPAPGESSTDSVIVSDDETKEITETEKDYFYDVTESPYPGVGSHVDITKTTTSEFICDFETGTWVLSRKIEDEVEITQYNHYGVNGVVTATVRFFGSAYSKETKYKETTYPGGEIAADVKTLDSQEQYSISKPDGNGGFRLTESFGQREKHLIEFGEMLEFSIDRERRLVYYHGAGDFWYFDFNEVLSADLYSEYKFVTDFHREDSDGNGKIEGLDQCSVTLTETIGAEQETDSWSGFCAFFESGYSNLTEEFGSEPAL